MASTEARVIGALLGVIRSRREPIDPADRNLQNCSAGSRTSPKLREANFSDFISVVALKRRWGLVPDSIQNWERLWKYNPVLAQAQVERPIGWVLEAEGKVVGYLGNVSSSYQLGDRILTAVTGSGFVLEPAYRALGFSLMASFYRQRGVDLYLGTTAVEAVAQFAKAFKSDPLPQPDYESVLFWVLDPASFSRFVLEKLEFRLSLSLSKATAALASFGLRADKLLRRRWPAPSRTSLTVKEISVGEIGDAFQDLWLEKLTEGPHLLADRSAMVLRWHFDIPEERGRTRVLCCYQVNKLLGYVVIRTESNHLRLRRSIIADMLVLNDEPTIVESLLVAAYRHAKNAGSHVLEVIGFPQSIRQVCYQSNPYQRKYPACPFYYKAADPILHKILSHGDAWYATPFDGDTTLMP